jgi:DNA-binding Lrp family transcriptional regulator
MTNRIDEIDWELLQLLVENGMMHTSELAAALSLTEGEVCSRMERLQRLGLVGYTPVQPNQREQN